MKLVDLHCDTAGMILRNRVPLAKNELQISLEKAGYLEKYVQLAAVFTWTELTDEEGWSKFHEIRENLERECAENGITLAKTASELESSVSERKVTLILTVEDARILDGRIERVRELYDCGVRVMTPLWGGETCIGGAHNTASGLSDFGKEAVAAMCECGIIPDISHASFRSADDIMDICEKYGVSPVATHMNSYAVCAHSRNLTDERYLRLTKLGGVAGVSLCPPHLTSGSASASDVIRHMLHYRALCPEHVCLGCDLDGTTPPPDLSDLSRLSLIPNLLSREGLSPEEVNAICFDTAYRFLVENLGKSGTLSPLRNSNPS